MRDWAPTVVYVLVSLAVVARAVRVRDGRAAWTILAVGLALYAAGNLLWTFWIAEAGQTRRSRRSPTCSGSRSIPPATSAWRSSPASSGQRRAGRRLARRRAGRPRRRHDRRGLHLPAGPRRRQRQHGRRRHEPGLSRRRSAARGPCHRRGLAAQLAVEPALVAAWRRLPAAGRRRHDLPAERRGRQRRVEHARQRLLHVRRRSDRRGRLAAADARARCRRSTAGRSCSCRRPARPAASRCSATATSLRSTMSRRCSRR